MDPNANLEEQLDLAKKIIVASDRGSFLGVYSAERLAELVIALDEWIKNGGFIPRRWRKNENV